MSEDIGVHHHQPSGPAFDIALILHVACVAVGLVTLATGTSTALRLRTLLRRGATFPDAVTRYFRPGINWAGRAVYGVPVFGFALLALSHGSYSLGQGWVLGGLMILATVVVVAEGSVWPAERRLQVSLVELSGGGTPVGESVSRDARIMAASGTLAIALLVLGSALMVAQP